MAYKISGTDVTSSLVPKSFLTQAVYNQLTLLVTSGNTLWTWGYNTYGQLGDGTVASKSSPVQTIAGGTNWSQVSAGYNTTAAIQL